jgi:hypothetical protein
MRNPPFKLEVYGRRFGLGSNAVHYLDLFSMVTGRDDVSITDAQLSPELFPSKRGEGFIEIEGKISGKDGAGNQFSISSLESEPADVRVQLTGSGRTVMVNETLRYIMINKGNTDSEEAFEEPMVSRCTTAICAHILERGSCQLPSLESSRNIHNELFRVFRSHVEKMRGSCPEKIPIT